MRLFILPRHVRDLFPREIVRSAKLDHPKTGQYLIEFVKTFEHQYLIMEDQISIYASLISAINHFENLWFLVVENEEKGAWSLEYIVP